MKSRILRIKLDPIMFEQIFKQKSVYHKYIAFASGSLLAISESLAFSDSVKYNGILHAILGIVKEYKEDFK